MTQFNEIGKTNPLFPVLLSFRKSEQRMIENLAKYLPEIEGRYIAVPFLHGDFLQENETVYFYSATYDKFAKEFINIQDTLGRIIIDLRPERKRHGGNGAIGMG